MPLVTVNGDLLSAKTEYIVQQCCCTAMRPHGLSETIATKWPHIDPYSSKTRLVRNWCTVDSRPTPGSIQVFENAEGPNVICAFGQYTHGKPGAYDDPAKTGVPDDARARLGYFKACLAAIAAIKPCSVGFPFRIGSGLAGGYWLDYESAIAAWSARNPDIEVLIYKL